MSDWAEAEKQMTPRERVLLDAAMFQWPNACRGELLQFIGGTDRRDGIHPRSFGNMVLRIIECTKTGHYDHALPLEGSLMTNGLGSVEMANSAAIRKRDIHIHINLVHISVTFAIGLLVGYALGVH